MTQAWILTAVGKDRPGMVAGLTGILYTLGCNLEDSAMTRLAGEFAMMLVFSGPSSLTIARLERACAPAAKRLGLALQVRPLKPAERTASSSGTPYLITVYGGDKPGIVFRVSEFLARARVNITNVVTHRTPGSGRTRPGPPGAPAGAGTPSLYLLILEVELPARLNARPFGASLRRMASSLGVEVSIRSADTSVL